MNEGPRSHSLADKIDFLFKTVHASGRAEATYAEVAAAVTAATGISISASYLHQLRMGQKDNPTKRHLEALAKFFGVPPAYFFDDETTARVEAELALLTAVQDAGVRDVALRASGLSAKSLDAITDMINRVRELEGLTPHRNE